MSIHSYTNNRKKACGGCKSDWGSLNNACCCRNGPEFGLEAGRPYETLVDFLGRANRACSLVDKADTINKFLTGQQDNKILHSAVVSQTLLLSTTLVRNSVIPQHVAFYEHAWQFAVIPLGCCLNQIKIWLFFSFDKAQNPTPFSFWQAIINWVDISTSIYGRTFKLSLEVMKIYDCSWNSCPSYRQCWRYPMSRWSRCGWKTVQSRPEGGSCREEREICLGSTQSCVRVSRE